MKGITMRRPFNGPKVEFLRMTVPFGDFERPSGAGTFNIGFALSGEAALLHATSLSVGLNHSVFDDAVSEDGTYYEHELLGICSGVSPGVAVQIERQTPNPKFVILCDFYKSAIANLYAIATHLEALRGLTRWATCSPEWYSRFEFSGTLVRNKAGRFDNCSPLFPESPDDLESLFLWISWFLGRSDRKVFVEVADMCQGQGHRFIERMLNRADPGLANQSSTFDRIKQLQDWFWNPAQSKGLGAETNAR
jgi:hypothetical protein